MSDTIRKGIIDVTPYQNDTSLFMVGNVAALSGNSIEIIIEKCLHKKTSSLNYL